MGTWRYKLLGVRNGDALVGTSHRQPKGLDPSTFIFQWSTSDDFLPLDCPGLQVLWTDLQTQRGKERIG